MENTETVHELRQRIPDYSRLRWMTTDKQFVEAIDRIIAETEEALRQLSADQARSGRA